MAQKRVIFSMYGPQLRRIIDLMVPMTREQREDYMKTMSNAKMAAIAEVLSRYKDRLDQINQIIVWEMPDGKSHQLEVQGRKP